MMVKGRKVSEVEYEHLYILRVQRLAGSLWKSGAYLSRYPVVLLFQLV